MPEDEQKNAEAKLQKVHDKYIAKIEELLAEKDKGNYDGLNEDLK